MLDSIATYPRKLTATYAKWGNLYRARFYIDGKRVPEWAFDAKLNALTKHDAGYTRTQENVSKIAGYRINWTRG
jgi:hypothetical protein